MSPEVRKETAMRRLLFLLPILLLSFGCAQNHFNVPTENFADKVKVLGVVPIIVDAGSDIRHPQKDQLISLVTGMNRRHEQQFVRKLKETGNFYTVALMDGDPDQIFASLLYRREKRDDATIRYNKYFWKNDELREYLRRNNLDAVMLIVVSGLGRVDKVSSSTLLSSLTSEYNYLIMTAQIMDANGAILWEYPNFRRRLLTYYPMIALQYPDFSEAEANLSAAAEVKFKTIEGITRRFEEKRKDLLLRETQESDVYGTQFDEMISLLRYDPDKEKKDTAPATAQPLPAGAPPKTPEARPAVVPAPPPAPVPDGTVPASGKVY